MSQVYSLDQSHNLDQFSVCERISAAIYVVDCKFRQFISVVGISAPQSFSIMDLQRCCIHILPPLSGDMQVNEYFGVYMYLLLNYSKLINYEANVFLRYLAFFSCRCCCTQAACCISRNIQASKYFSRQTPTYQYC